MKIADRIKFVAAKGAVEVKAISSNWVWKATMLPTPDGGCYFDPETVEEIGEERIEAILYNHHRKLGASPEEALQSAQRRVFCPNVDYIEPFNKIEEYRRRA